MKRFLTGLLLASAIGFIAKGEEVTLNFADCGLDNGASLTDYKVNDNLTFSSDGTWNDGNGDYRLFAGRTLTVQVADATLTGVSITCEAGRGFSASTVVTADSEASEFTADPFSWTGSATETWSLTAAAANNNVRMKSITFTYTPKAVSETLTAEFLCKDMGVGDGESMPAEGFEANEYININFLQGTHAAKPTYMASYDAFRLFNGQQLAVNVKDGAKLLKIEVATTTANPFQYYFSAGVTADGVPQTVETDFTWVPCEWHGTAEQDVIFTAGLSSGNVRVTGITVTYQTPGEGLVVAKPEIVASETDNSVTINCATEGASIYYTLDGEEPTEEAGTKYEEPVTLTEACTVKAIAVMEGVSSSVASLDVYLRIVESLEQFLANASPETVKIECAVTAIETIGDYLMVKDDKGSYAIIHTLNNELKEDLNVENGYTWDGMTADFESYGTYGFIQPVSLGEGEQKEAVTPKEVSVTEFECVPFEYVKVQGLAVEKNYRYLTFTDINGNELDGYQFFLAVEIPTPEEATRYDVTGFASNEGDELWPASFVVNVNSGVNTVESDDSEGVYFNMQGIKIDNPNDKGVYIVVKNGKAQKRVVK